MSTDFENELRDLFREKAGEAPLATPTLPASAPRQVLRRGRLRQAGTVLGSAVVIVALIVGSVAGLTRILGEGKTTGRERRLRGLPTNSDGRGVHREEPIRLVPGERVAVVDGDRRSRAPVAASSACVQRPETRRGVRRTPARRRRPRSPCRTGCRCFSSRTSTSACRERVRRRSSRRRRRSLRGVRLRALRSLASRIPRARSSLQGVGLPRKETAHAGPVATPISRVNGERFFAWIGVGSEVSARGPGNGRDLLRDDVGDPRLGAARPRTRRPPRT